MTVMNTEPRTPGRPRRAETDQQIVHATQELLREHGPSAVNVAAVAARSGIARTTIYRRYTDRGALLAAALEPITDRGAPPAGDTVPDKLLWLLARIEEVLGSGIGLGGVASVLAGTDPEFATALRGALERGLLPVREQIESDMAAGVLVDDLEPDLLLDLLLGAYLAAHLRRGTPGPQWRTTTADLLSRLLTGGRHEAQ